VSTRRAADAAVPDAGATQPVTIGTAGHIDHGKSALVKALTGIDPDRLAEEQRRGMTLDLGFAHIDLPSGRRVGIVDVPGHEALIHNMLAGAGGMDLVMLVVAADEGPMPQTREHVDILRFMPLSGGVVVLSKVDLVEDPEWLAVVEDDVQALVAGTALEGAVVVRASSRTGQGLDNLRLVLDRLAAGVPLRPADGPVRLPVDRSFTMSGFGTVVTGTLWGGTIRVGNHVVVLPQGREVRVRGVQVHGETRTEARAGSRVAVNLVGLEKADVVRGDVVATREAFVSTDRINVRLRLLAGAPALRHGARVHLHLGSGATVARVVLLEASSLAPGSDGLVQLRLEAPVIAVHGDHFVVRRYSPTETLGGGVVLEAVAGAGRRTAETRKAAMAADRAGPAALVVAAVAARGPVGLAAAATATAAGVDGAAAARALEAARAAGDLVVMADRVYARSAIIELRRKIMAVLDDAHARFPWRRGVPREDLKSRASTPGADRLFDAILAEVVNAGEVTERLGMLAGAGFAATLSDADRRTRDLVLAAVERGGAAPPAVEELRKMASVDAVDRALQTLTDDGIVVAVSPDLRLSQATVNHAQALVIEMVRQGHDVTVASLRDRLHTSRRYALALLEYFDTERVTRRVGDRRVLGPAAQPAP
jgi:selenocysteine-specific elongation factor